MFTEIMAYIDHIFQLIRPTRLLYIAIGFTESIAITPCQPLFFLDGVAPRAKMNQQRSRRFQAGEGKVSSQSEIKNRLLMMTVCSYSHFFYC